MATTTRSSIKVKPFVLPLVMIFPPQNLTWLTEDGIVQEGPHLARLGANLVAGYSQDSDSLLLLASIDNGQPVGAPESVPAANLSSAGDFFVYANGDVGWPLISGSTISLARLRDCAQ